MLLSTSDMAHSAYGFRGTPINLIFSGHLSELVLKEVNGINVIMDVIFKLAASIAVVINQMI